MKTYNFARSLLFFLVGAATLYVAFEIFLAIAERTPLGKIIPLIEPQLGKPDAYAGFAFIPGAQGMWTRENRAHIKINAMGLRDDETTLKKPEGAFRVALMGDSITEALQVENEHTYENLAEESLKEQGRFVEIINLAMSGNGPLRQLVRFESKGLQFSPDLVIFQFAAADFLSGEMFDDSQNPGYKMNDQGDIIRSYAYKNRFSQRHIDSLFFKVFFKALQHSHILRAINNKRRAFLSQEGAFLKILNLNVPTWSFSEQPMVFSDKNTCDYPDLKAQYDLWVRHKPSQTWLGVQKFMEEVSSLSVQHKFKALIAARNALPAVQCNEALNMRSKVVRSMESAFKRRALRFVDWDVVLMNSANAKSDNFLSYETLYGFGSSLGDGHLNYEGHKAFAKTLEKIVFPFVKDSHQ